MIGSLLSRMSDAEKLSPSQLQQTVKDGVLPEGIANLVNQTKPKATPPMPNQESTVADEVMGEVDRTMNPEDRIQQKIDSLKMEINQIHQGVQAGEVKPYIGIPLLKEKVQELSQLEAMMQPPMQQAPMGQPPMGEMMQPQEQMPQGIDAAQSNLPTQMAQGGIASFASGGETDEDYEDQSIDEDYDRAMSMIGNPSGEAMLPGAIMSRASKPSSKPSSKESSKPSSSSEIVTTGGVGVPTKLGKTTFDTAMNFVFPHEGGYGFHPADRGGHTKHGVIQNTLSAYLKRPASVEDVKNLTPEVARDLYKNMFWEPTRKQLAKYGMENDPQAQLVAFNAAMASGPGYSNPLIAKHKGDPYGMLREHTKFMVEDIPRRDPSQLVFQKGWGNRQRDLEALIKQVKPSYAEGGIAALASGGEVKHFAGKDGSEVEDLYPGATRDKELYQGIANLPSRIAKYLMPSRVIDDIGSIVNWGQTPVQQQFKDKYPELYAKNQREKDAKEGMINKPYSLLSPELKAQEDAYINAPNVFGRKDGETLNRQPFESNFPVNQPNVIQPKINTGAVNPITPAANVDKGEMGPPASLMGDAEPKENQGIASKGLTYNDLINRMMGQEQDIKQQKEEDKYMSLLAAGLGMMGGTSQYAGANIGQGAMAGIQNYANAAKNRIAEKAALNKNLSNIVRFQEVGDIQRNSLIQQAQISNARIAAELRGQDLSSQDRQRLLDERRDNNILINNNRADLLSERKEAREDTNKRFNMGIIEKMQKDAQTAALANLKLNPIVLMNKSPEEIAAITSPEIRKLLNNKRYRELHSQTYGYDPYENVDSETNKQDRKPLSSFQGK